MTNYLSLKWHDVVCRHRKWISVYTDEVILGYQTLRARSIEPLAGWTYCAWLCVPYFTASPLVKARMRTPSFRNIDFTAADIPARVLARAGTSSRKCEVPAPFVAVADEVGSDVRSEWQSCRAIFCITARHLAIRRHDRRPGMADGSDRCARRREDIPSVL